MSARLLALIFALLLTGAVAEHVATELLADVPCAEDDPCWDCTSMGNLICGP